MSSKRPIFNTDRRGIEVNGGRKANILASMAKKAELSLLNMDKLDQQPFSAHSFSSNQSLATSQVNEVSTTSASFDSMRQLIKQQVERQLMQQLMARDKYFNQQLKQLQTRFKQVATVVQAFDQKSKQMLDEKAKDLRAEFAQVQLTHQTTTSTGLKKIVDIINKKITDLDKQFVPISFVEDMEKEIENVHDRIDGLEKAPLDASMMKRQTQSLLTKEIEVNFSKSMRQVENLKKTVTLMNDEKNKMHSQIVEMHKIMGDLTEKNSQSQATIEILTKKSNQEFQKELNKLRTEMEQNTAKINKGITQKFESVNLLRMTSSESRETDSPGIKKITIPSIISEPTVTSIIMGSKAPESNVTAKKSLSLENSSQNAVSIQISSTELAKQKEAQQPKQLYQIDKDGYLQDENGNYLLDAENKFIILSQEQINTLKETNLLVSDDS